MTTLTGKRQKSRNPMNKIKMSGLHLRSSAGTSDAPVSVKTETAPKLILDSPLDPGNDEILGYSGAGAYMFRRGMDRETAREIVGKGTLYGTEVVFTGMKVPRQYLPDVVFPKRFYRSHLDQLLQEYRSMPKPGKK